MLESIDQYVCDNMIHGEEDDECSEILEVINSLLIPDPINRSGIKDIFLNYEMFQNIVDHSQENMILEPAYVTF